MRTDTPKTIYLKDYKEPDYLVETIDMVFQIFDDHTLVKATTKFRKNHSGKAPLVLDGEELILKSVTLNAEIVSDYEEMDRSLSIPCPDQDEFVLEIETEIDPAANTALEGLYKSQGNYCTQCEAEGFRRITFYPDRPDVMAVFTVRVEADKASCPVLLSNGNLIENGDLGDGRHYTVWHDPFPKPCYLFALVAGDLVYIEDQFTTMSGRNVTLRIYVRDGDQGQCDHAMESLKNSMKWDEDVYGREYQLDLFNIVAVSDFNMGAMENTSLNIFNTALVLAHHETATDTDFERVEGVIGHEYFHNWSGNRVTCRDWFQLSLKEGFTVFRDQSFSGDMNSAGVQRIDDVALLRRMQFPEDAGPMAHPIRPDHFIKIDNFYTVTVYEKGAEVIRMQYNLLGAETFRKGTDLYFERYDGQAVTCDDFVACMEEVSGLDLTQFKLWYSQAGTPEIKARGVYNEDDKSYELILEQTIPSTPGQQDKKPMHIPVRVGLVGPNGDDVVEQTLELTKTKQSFVFKDVGSRPVPSILRGFSAPVKLTTDLSNDDLRFLMVHDNDGFNQWEAGQTYALRLMNAMLDSQDSTIWPEFIDSFGLMLDQAFDASTDKALLARALSLPDISVIAQSRDIVDPSAIYDVRQGVMQALAGKFKDQFQGIYDANRTNLEFQNDFAARSQRSLQNTALRYLSADLTNPAYETASAQYFESNNMTDRVAALAVLSDADDDVRDKAFDDFYECFKDYPLVIDKWFSLQAMVVRDQSYDDLQSLSGHEAFNILNPNRVLSLYAAFAMNNPVKFHDPSGKGYQFLTDAIIKLNDKNPQIASRLLTPMREWRRYTDDRQAMMKASLEKIAALPDLSENVSEVVEKCLSS